MTQSCFEKQKGNIRKNSSKIVGFKQAKKDVEVIYRDISRFDMSYEEIGDLCRGAWKEEDYIYLYSFRSPKTPEGKLCFCNESKASLSYYTENKSFLRLWIGCYLQLNLRKVQRS